MMLKEYIKSRGLRAAHVAQKVGVTRQAVDLCGKKHMPTVKTLEKYAAAMTELGAPTTVVDIVTALYEDKD